jgi:hypothetical protein
MSRDIQPLCLYRKLNSTIMVVKATDDRLRCDAAYVLDGTWIGASLPRNR